MNIQANLPDTLPGQNVVFMLLGETELENAVAPEDAYIPGGMANVTTSMGVDLRYQPDLNADIVGNIAGGTTIIADAISADGQWLRVTVGENFGWVMSSMVTTTDDITTLGVMGPNTRTPMQAFYFRNNIRGTECTEAPDSLVVQGPQDLTIDINIAGADIRLGSTALFRIIPVDEALLGILRELYGDDIQVGSLLQVIAIDGTVYINPDTPEEQVVQPGWSTTRCLSLPEDLGLDGEINDGEIFAGCPWSDQRALAPEELELFRVLDGFGEGILNYPLEIPNLPDEEPTPTSSPTRAPQVVVLPRASSTPLVTATPIPTSTFTPWPFIPSDTPLPPPVPTITTAPPVCPLTFPVDIPNGDIAGLRAAITAGNNPACSGAVINLAGEGTYTFTDVAAGENALPVITGNITINGVGSSLTRDSGMPVPARLVEIAPGGVLQLGSVYVNSWSAAGSGGAILNGGTLFVSFTDFQSNRAGGSGGAIYNSGTLNLDNVIIGVNSAGSGGGLYNAGTTTITNTTINSNAALLGGAGKRMPGFVLQTQTQGGGIYNSGTITLLNSTLFANNSDVGDGGNIYNVGTVNASFITIAGGFGISGREIANGATFNLRSSLVASYGFGGGVSCSGSINAVNSYADDASCSNLNVVGTLGLDSGLSFPGGFGGVLALQFGSPVVDVLPDCNDVSGSTVFGDQTGNARPLDGNQDTTFQCDPGAVEFDPLIFYLSGT